LLAALDVPPPAFRSSAPAVDRSRARDLLPAVAVRAEHPIRLASCGARSMNGDGSPDHVTSCVTEETAGDAFGDEVTCCEFHQSLRSRAARMTPRQMGVPRVPLQRGEIAPRLRSTAGADDLRQTSSAASNSMLHYARLLRDVGSVDSAPHAVRYLSRRGPLGKSSCARRSLTREMFAPSRLLSVGVRFVLVEADCAQREGARSPGVVGSSCSIQVPSGSRSSPSKSPTRWRWVGQLVRRCIFRPGH